MSHKTIQDQSLLASASFPLATSPDLLPLFLTHCSGPAFLHYFLFPECSLLCSCPVYHIPFTWSTLYPSSLCKPPCGLSFEARQLNLHSPFINTTWYHRAEKPRLSSCISWFVCYFPSSLFHTDRLCPPSSGYDQYPSRSYLLYQFRWYCATSLPLEYIFLIRKHKNRNPSLQIIVIFEDFKKES